MEALNLVGVLAISEWRKAWSVYYPLDIRKVRAALPSPSTLAPKSSEQPLTAQTILPPLRLPKDPAKLVIKAKESRQPRIKVRARRSSPPQRPRMLPRPRMPPRPRTLQSKQRMSRPNPKRLTPKPKILLPPNRVRKMILLLQLQPSQCRQHQIFGVTKFRFHSATYIMCAQM